jgi:hypothetical protein
VLLVETVRKTGLDRAMSGALTPWHKQRAVHDPAKILLDVASHWAGTAWPMSGCCGPSRPCSVRLPHGPRGPECASANEPRAYAYKPANPVTDYIGECKKKFNTMGPKVGI